MPGNTTTNICEQHDDVHEGESRQIAEVFVEVKDRANTPGNYIRRLSLEGLSAVQHMTGLAYL